MKTTLTSNWRPLLRAFYPFLIAAAALWAIPRNATAQLYVVEGGNLDLVTEFSAKTGDIPNQGSPLIQALVDPKQLALSGNTLFVSEAVGTIGKYDATTGAAINPSFITGLHSPRGLAVLGNILFVANFGGRGTVGKYDATTGATINPSFIAGLNEPFGLAVLGNTLFVANSGGTTVGKYDATTGVAINPSFITGLIVPIGLAVKSAE